MRCSASFPDRPKAASSGFTLLELVVAMSCSALLVALLVGVWMQVLRTSETVLKETAEQRRMEVERRELRDLLHGLRWQPGSLSAQTPQPWREEPRRLTVWSDITFGKGPGPVQWSFESAPEGLHAAAWDPSAPAAAAPGPDWPDVRGLRVEVMEDQITEQGEHLRWLGLSQWDPARPFRPLGIRLWIRWKDQEAEECLLRTL